MKANPRSSNFTPYGTITWAGEVGSKPALLLSHKKGCSLWRSHITWWGFGPSKWTEDDKFANLLEAYKELQIELESSN